MWATMLTTSNWHQNMPPNQWVTWRNPVYCRPRRHREQRSLEDQDTLLSVSCRLPLLILLFSENTYFINISWPLPRNISTCSPFIHIEAHMMLSPSAFMCPWLYFVVDYIAFDWVFYLPPFLLSDHERLPSTIPIHICVSICHTSWCFMCI